MTSVEQQLVMAGMPGTGKTSFLALLWLALEGGHTVDLQLANFQDDRSYLLEISRRLQRCEEINHTEVGEDRELRLNLLAGPTSEPALLRIPDLSGETWQDATLDRQWPDAVEADVRSAHGFILFVHSRNIDAGAGKAQVAALTAALGPDKDAVAGSQEPHSEPAQPKDSSGRARPKAPPTQVTATDFLQLACEQRARRPCRVAIVVSAWDLVSQETKPGEFIATNLPLVQQYADSHGDWLELRVFGLSAQGGQFDEEHRDGLAREDPVERAIVVDDSGSARIEAIPLWALGASAA